MKKKFVFVPKIRDCYLKKLCLMMRLMLFLIFVSVFVASANTASSQSGKLSMTFENVSLTEVFEEIESQLNIGFLLPSDLLKDQQKISMSVKNSTVEGMLHQILDSRGYEFEFVGKNVVVTQIPSIQQKTIFGIVTDSSGAPLPGVTVVVKGTTQGIITDTNGNYLLSNVPENAILSFSFIGMKTQEIAIDGKASINIIMVEESIGIEEVVAIGYGTKSKETLTGAISVIDDKVLEGRPAMQTTDLLQGVSSGLQITRTNTGNLRNSTNSISIRGLTSRSNPGVLVVIDGIAQASTDANALDNINPNDIENISVLKDSQAAIYGARAAGGVIIVTTKHGKSDKPVFKFSYNYTLQKPSLMLEDCNILQLVEMHNEGYINDGTTSNAYSPVVKYIADNNITLAEVKENNNKHVMSAPFGLPWALGYYDWNDIMFDPSPMQDLNLSISGQNDRVNYYESISYTDQKGMLAYGSNFSKRLLITLKNDFNITNFLKVKTNFRLGNQKITEPYNYSATNGDHSYAYANGGVQGALNFLWPSSPPYTKGGHYYSMGGFYNAIGFAEAGGNTTDLIYKIDGNIGVEITPIKDISVIAEIATNFDIRESDWANIGFDMYDYNDVFAQSSTLGNDQAGADYYRNRYTEANIYAKYDFTKLANHKISLMAGYSHEDNNYRSFSAYRQYGFITLALPTMSMGSAAYQYNSEVKNDNALNSVFSRFDYAYKNRYLFEGIYRYDGSSKFAVGYKWSPFYGLSGGWVISEESFMKNLKNVFDFMKIRASWGQMGNQASIGLYDYISQISIGGSYPMGSLTSPTLTQYASLGSMASDTRTWETIASTNLGIDLTAFNSKLSASFDVYNKENKDMFYTKEFPKVLGTNAPSINGAHVRTKGWEIELGWRNKINQFNYSINMNLSNYNSDVIELADAATPYQGINTFVQGNPINSYYGLQYDGLIKTEAELDEYNSKFTSGIPNNLKIGDARFKDLDGDGKLESLAYTVDKDGNPTATSGDLIKIGDGGQHYLYGISLGLNWKNFDFRAFFQGVQKWQVVSEISPISAFFNPIVEYSYHQTFSQERNNALYPRLSQDATVINYNNQYSDAPYKLYNNNYIRLKNIQLGYTLPKKITNKVELDKVSVYVSGTDIWEFSNLPGNQDPETPFAKWANSPFPRQYSFGINVTF